MNNRLSRLAGLTSTMRKLEGIANADAIARRDDEERSRQRLRQAHATAAASRSESGSLAVFLASRQVAGLAADAVAEATAREAEAAAEAALALENLREARTRTNAMARLADDARREVQAALDAADAAVVDDMIAARAARIKREGHL